MSGVCVCGSCRRFQGEKNQSDTFVKHILSVLSATDNLCIVVEFMTWREAQMEDESGDLSVAKQAVAWTEPRMRKWRELNTGIDTACLLIVTSYWCQIYGSDLH